jgi:hypothetical protein
MMTLYRYRLARTAAGALYAYGYDRSTAEVRIVELQEFDETVMTGMTRGGDSVTLEGEPAKDMNASALFVYYCNENALGMCTDATPALAVLRAATTAKTDAEAEAVVRQRYGEGRELGDTPADDDTPGTVQRS